MYSISLLIAVLLLIVLFSAVWKIHPVPVLLGAGLLWGLASGLGPETTLKTLAAGFGKTMEGIGLVIIAGTVIGLFMERRGALALLAERTIRLTGPKRIPPTLAGIGFIASIPIFCDSAFVILIGLARNICRKGRVRLAVGATALAMGLYASHCIIPPTPGPIAAASLLGADLGLTILFGCPAAFVAAVVGCLFAVWAGKSVRLEGENAPDSVTLDSSEVDRAEGDGAVESSPESAAPACRSVELAALPILIPLTMILVGSFFNFLASDGWKAAHPTVVRAVGIVGLPVVALGVGAILAIFCLGRREPGELTVGGILGDAVRSASNILVITASGGAFGELLRAHLDFGETFTQGAGGIWPLFLAAAVAAFIKTAQGSSTVALLTTAGLFAPLLEPMGLGSPPLTALTVTAIGAGSMIVSHANDSFFWVVTQFSGMNVRQGLRLHTLGTLVSGLAATGVVGLTAFLVRRFG